MNIWLVFSLLNSQFQKAPPPLGDVTLPDAPADSGESGVSAATCRTFVEQLEKQQVLDVSTDT